MINNLIHNLKREVTCLDEHKGQDWSERLLPLESETSRHSFTLHLFFSRVLRDRQKIIAKGVRMNYNSIMYVHKSRDI